MQKRHKNKELHLAILTQRPSLFAQINELDVDKTDKKMPVEDVELVKV